MDDLTMNVFICKICESDSKLHKALGMCGTCYRRSRNKRKPSAGFCVKCQQPSKFYRGKGMCDVCYERNRCEKKLSEGWICPICKDPSKSFKNNNMCRTCYTRERRRKISIGEWSCKICGDSYATIKTKKMCDTCHKYSRLAMNTEDRNDPLNAIVSLYELLDETEQIILREKGEMNLDDINKAYDRINSNLSQIRGMNIPSKEGNLSDKFNRILCFITGTLTERIERIEMNRADMNKGETRRKRRKT